MGDLSDERTFLERDKNGKDRNGCSVSRELKHSVYVTLQDQRQIGRARYAFPSSSRLEQKIETSAGEIESEPASIALSTHVRKLN